MNKQVKLARPTAKPKRPLSAFNLFYRFKRQKVLEVLAVAVGTTVDKDTICGLVTVPPGLEYYPASALKMSSPNMLNALRRKNIRKDLEQNMEPRDTKTRAHRKNQGAMNGAMSFVEMGKLMNTSWKSCDDFAKSVFNELSEEGRKRYRQRVQDYNAQSQSLEFDKAMPTFKKKSTKKKLSTKKKIAAKASSLPLLKNGGSANGSLTNETAEITIALTKRSSSKGYKMGSSLTKKDNSAVAPSLLDLLVKPIKGFEMCSSLTKKDNRAVAPSLLDLLVKKDILNEASIRAVSNDNSNFHSSQEILPVIFPNAPKEIEERLIMLRVREIERQLAEERLWSRIRELEDEMSKRNARERLLRSVLDNFISQNKSTAVAPALPNRSFMHDGLWGLVSASMIHPSVQASERAAMLSRMVEAHHAVTPSKRLSSTVSRSNSPESLEGRLNKKQRLD
eukprot:CAMPEP_0201945602 /NCGR_PEP_ID=MMETSP0903-20130614/53988_1 /ASSEMBLY_ACC=CAM_ASM_000552 /TAXON_ID=420261 /ORGANISM="Thalassiosira antarctica, Strain CCMP982" /LENGTH=449 /DNA_ID=CAMNT_0048488671 /DNA_START=58 /DNA_END=1408 /DNA_ORIENTATION=-